MSLDVQTLLVSLMLCVFAVALALPAVVGWRSSAGARWIQASAVSQALGWLAFLAAPRLHDQFFSTLSMAFIGASFGAMWAAARAWLGPRPGGRWMAWALVLTPLGYGLGFDSYAWRVGWSNFGLALQMALVCLALAWPAAERMRPWRWLVFVALAALACVTVGRGVLGAFFTELYPYYRAPHPLNVAAALVNQICLVLSMLGFMVAWHEEADRALRRLADTDGLTGLLNRRAFTVRSEALLAQARRHADPGVFILLDIDHFKQVNDRHGHALGDEVLRTFAKVLKSSLRRGDLAVRWGGEEFGILLARAEVDAARRLDQRLRTAVKQAVRLPGGESLDYSAGIAGFREAATLDDLVRRADQALYRAKAAGRARSLEAAPFSPPTAEGRPSPA
ncbi:MAG: GGDEF domain-containing protein [Pseudomonadota bacterium]|uniref:diguanylate cyclase n=2 Tax=Pseudomonadota TaxID=1224 RepID=A0ABY6MUM3_9BURK|nr:GGDEF domain-containing protein [Schlegelella aquatica]UZD55699.1 GGDEF domain-containing protein [Schlegelella aquatica]